jgi:hypothetical protein
VAVFEEGDWFEYGHDGPAGFEADSYWETSLPPEEWKAIVTRAFGPDFWTRAGQPPA